MLMGPEDGYLISLVSYRKSTSIMHQIIYYINHTINDQHLINFASNNILSILHWLALLSGIGQLGKFKKFLCEAGVET